MARYKKTVSVGQVLGRSKFRQFKGSGRNLQTLDQIVKQHLDDSLKQRCQVTQYEKTTLSLSVDNGATATKLRYQIPMLKQLLAGHSEFYTLKNIKYHIRKDVVVQKVPTYRPMNRLSSRNAKLIQETAKGIRDPELSAALIRLSKNT